MFSVPYVPKPLRKKAAISPTTIIERPKLGASFTPSLDAMKKPNTQESNKPNKVPPKKPPTTGTKKVDSDSSSSSDSESESDRSEDKPNREKKMNRQRNRKPRSERPLGTPPSTSSSYQYTSAQVTSDSTDFNRESSNPFPTYINVGMDEKVTFSTTLKTAFMLNEYYGSDYSQTKDIIPKVFVDLASYGTGLANPDGYQDGFLNEIFNVYNRDVIGRAKSSQVTASWTLAKFKTYVAKMATALEFYYAIDSIMAYDIRQSKERDKNLTFIEYQQNFENFDQIVRYKDMLSKYIRGMWFPPRFSSLIRWTFQNFKVANLEQSAICRLVPGTEFVYDTSRTFDASRLNTKLNSIITDLSTSDNGNISSILSYIYPTGRINSLPLSTKIPFEDQNFTELITNRPCLFKDGTTVSIFPYTTSGSTEDRVYYANRPPEQLDGFVSALHPMATGTASGSNNIGTAPVWIAGLLQPFMPDGLTPAMNNICSRYVLDGKTKSMLGRVGIYNENAAPDCNLVDILPSGAYAGTSGPLLGFQRVYFNNVKAPVANLGYFMDWLFNIKNVTE